jgi:hypothetical protein
MPYPLLGNDLAIRGALLDPVPVWTSGCLATLSDENPEPSEILLAIFPAESVARLCLELVI